MKKLFNLLTINILIVVSAFAQETNRTFTVKDFDKLDIGNAFKINVSQGSGYKLEARGNEKDVEDLVAVVSGGKLVVKYRSNDWWKWHKKTIYLTITMPALQSAHFSGATSSKVSGFSSEIMDIDLSGASDATFNVNAKNVNIDCSGASDLTIIGNGDKMQAEVSGASELKAYDFKTSNAKVESSGASDAKVNVSGSLSASASGASDVRYKGNPSVTKNTSGASSVKGQ